MTSALPLGDDGIPCPVIDPTLEELNEIGATFEPPIEVITQPAQSPDFNINDLAFFRSLSVAVRKLRRGMVDFDKEKLAAEHDAGPAAVCHRPRRPAPARWRPVEVRLPARRVHDGGARRALGDVNLTRKHVNHTHR